MKVSGRPGDRVLPPTQAVQFQNNAGIWCFLHTLRLPQAHTENGKGTHWTQKWWFEGRREALRQKEEDDRLAEEVTGRSIGAASLGLVPTAGRGKNWAGVIPLHPSA